ncbi:MAG: dihydroorotate dehydrogenase-like protein [Planctomycetota bacterium]|nr:MAG: dihydroorotate dehydrogenase-like protein [Planctomycetota bacterium]
MSVDLSTEYLGLKLKNPLVAAASSLTDSLDNIKRLEEAGIAAVVLPSLFEEQIEHEAVNISEAHQFGTESYAESLSFFPEPEEYRFAPDEYLDKVRKAKESVGVPVIGSLNGTTEGGWIRYAKLIEEAGADALELNIYLIAANTEETSADVEKRYLDLVKKVTESVSIPVAVKVGPYFSSIGYMCRQIVDAGAKGLVLFNRFLQPDFDLETLEAKPHLVLSTEFESLLPLRWIAILHGRVGASLAITSGVHSAAGLIKAVLAGADAVQIASALYKQGFGCVGTMLSELERWMSEREYESVRQMCGSLSHRNSPDPEAFERGNYMKALASFTGQPI